MDGEIWFGVAALALLALFALAYALDLGGLSRRTVAKNQETVAAGRPTHGAYAETERQAKTRGWIMFGICLAGLIAVVIIGITR